MAATPPIDRAWVQARVDEHGSIEAARPEDVRVKVWRDVCRALGVTAKKVSPLEQALKALADSAQP